MQNSAQTVRAVSSTSVKEDYTSHAKICFTYSKLFISYYGSNYFYFYGISLVSIIEAQFYTLFFLY